MCRSASLSPVSSVPVRSTTFRRMPFSTSSSSDARGVCRQLLRRIRNHAALVMGFSSRQQGRKNHWFAEYFPHGLHAFARQLLVHRSHHRLPFGRSQHHGWFSPCSHHWYVRLCRSFGPAVHAVCPLPHVAQECTQGRWLVELRQGNPRFP